MGDAAGSQDVLNLHLPVHHIHKPDFGGHELLQSTGWSLHLVCGCPYVPSLDVVFASFSS